MTIDFRLGQDRYEDFPIGYLEAFTIGYAPSYDKALAQATVGSPVFKSGQCPGYTGGWVWRTMQEAFAFLSSSVLTRAFPARNATDFAVYRLRLAKGWRIDVSAQPHESDGVHRLLHEAVIVEKVKSSDGA